VKEEDTESCFIDTKSQVTYVGTVRFLFNSDFVSLLWILIKS
jgi:hypothetical protein